MLLLLPERHEKGKRGRGGEKKREKERMREKGREEGKERRRAETRPRDFAQSSRQFFHLFSSSEIVKYCGLMDFEENREYMSRKRNRSRSDATRISAGKERGYIMS